MKALSLALGLSTALNASPSFAQQQSTQGTGAMLRVLEKVSGQVLDFDMPNGASQDAGRLTITLRDCRYPNGNANGEAYAFLTVREKDRSDPVFEGWMIATSPALNAMEHSRYDVWVLRCKTE